MQGYLYGRRYRVGVQINDEEVLIVSDSDFEPNALKVTFDCNLTFLTWPWYCDVEIWNLSPQTQQKIFKSLGMNSQNNQKSTTGKVRVVIEAGYQDGPYGKIWDGAVFQPLFDRINVTDYVLTLRCANALDLASSNFTSGTIAGGYNYNAFIGQMAKNCQTPIPIGGITQNIGQQVFPRGRTYFGDPRTHLYNVSADDVDVAWWMDEGKLFVTNLKTDGDPKKALVLSPATGLVGTPQANAQGVEFSCFINPALKVSWPPMLVKLDQSIIRQEKFEIGEIPSPLDQDNIYQVIGVRHHGSTRGNEWYTDVYGANRYGLGNVTLLRETLIQANKRYEGS